MSLTKSHLFGTVKKDMIALVQYTHKVSSADVDVLIVWQIKSETRFLRDITVKVRLTLLTLD